MMLLNTNILSETGERRIVNGTRGKVTRFQSPDKVTLEKRRDEIKAANFLYAKAPVCAVSSSALQPMHHHPNTPENATHSASPSQAAMHQASLASPSRKSNKRSAFPGLPHFMPFLDTSATTLPTEGSFTYKSRL